jgi:heme exporter protein A
MTVRQAHRTSLNLKNVAIFRGNRFVLDHLNLAAMEGDTVWIRGANGSGKSTLLRTIAGLLDIHSGTVDIIGTVALSDENLALEANLPLSKALQFWAFLDNATPQDTTLSMTAMDIMSLSNVPIRYLSTGQRKRAGLARVLASKASIWLLDEPYNGLDSASSASLDAAIIAHSNVGGITLLAAHQSPSINVSQSVVLDRQVHAA